MAKEPDMAQPDQYPQGAKVYMYVSKHPAQTTSKAMTQVEDKELIIKFKVEASRNWAFNQIVRKYQQRVYASIRKMVVDHDDANDLTQETFVKAWKHLDNFREEAQLFTWLYRIAANESLNFLARKRRRFFVPIHDVRRELATKLDGGAGFTGDDIQLKLQKALLTLPDKQRLVFNLRYFDELSYEEMSEVTNTSVGALKASYHHAVKKIEAFLTKSIA
jgi:RNA polymerase sigma factor (sigma-70 family)